MAIHVNAASGSNAVLLIGILWEAMFGEWWWHGCM
jgi:hypothetical protein